MLVHALCRLLLPAAAPQSSPVRELSKPADTSVVLMPILKCWSVSFLKFIKTACLTNPV